MVRPLPGLRSLSKGSGGSSLITALSACQQVAVYGAGLMRLDGEAEGTVSVDSTLWGRPQLVYTHYYDVKAGRCTANTKMVRHVRRKLCKSEQCQATRKSWLRDRIEGELAMHVLHVLGVIDWRT